MGLKSLEHEGGEFFKVQPNRRMVKDEKLSREKKLVKDRENQLAEAQEDYLDASNPLLWDKDIED